MKRIIKTLLLVLAIAIVAPSTPALANKKEQRQLKKELRKKADRESRKEAKTYTKEGWRTMAGALPLAKQLQASKYSSLMKDEQGNPLYVIAEHKAIGGNYSLAKEIAYSRASAELASNICNTIAQNSDDRKGQENLGEGDIDVLDEYLSVTKSVVTAQLRGVQPVVELYRELANGNVEVMTVLRLEADSAIKAAKKEVRETMKARADKLAEDM